MADNQYTFRLNDDAPDDVRLFQTAYGDVEPENGVVVTDDPNLATQLRGHPWLSEEVDEPEPASEPEPVDPNSSPFPVPEPGEDI